MKVEKMIIKQQKQKKPEHTPRFILIDLDSMCVSVSLKWAICQVFSAKTVLENSRLQSQHGREVDLC